MIIGDRIPDSLEITGGQNNHKLKARGINARNKFHDIQPRLARIACQAKVI
jgi:hypothetical protein